MQLAAPTEKNTSTKFTVTNPSPEGIQVNNPGFLRVDNHTVIGKLK
jgi:hypothetical protein